MRPASWIPYLDAFRLGLIETLAYPSQVWMRLFMVPLAVAFQYAVYAALYSGGAIEIGGLTLAQMTGYVALVQILRTLFANNISIFIGQAIRSGQIATFLLRPLGFPGFAIAYISGRGASQVLTVGLPTLLAFAALGAVPVPASLMAFIAFLLFTLLGFLLYNLLFTLAGLLGFYMEFSGEIGWSVELIMLLLGGAVVPLSLFSKQIQYVANLLPFRFLYYQPVAAWLGKIPEETLGVDLLLATGWVGLATGWVALFYSRGRRHLSIQGG